MRVAKRYWGDGALSMPCPTMADVMSSHEIKIACVESQVLSTAPWPHMTAKLRDIALSITKAHVLPIPNHIHDRGSRISSHTAPVLEVRCKVLFPPGCQGLLVILLSGLAKNVCWDSLCFKVSPVALVAPKVPGALYKPNNSLDSNRTFIQKPHHRSSLSSLLARP